MGDTGEMASFCMCGRGWAWGWAWAWAWAWALGLGLGLGLGLRFERAVAACMCSVLPMSGRTCTLDAVKRTSLLAELCTRCAGASSSAARYVAMSAAPRLVLGVRVRC